jgi:hypothetical protein
MKNTLVLCAVLLAVSAVGQEKINYEDVASQWRDASRELPKAGAPRVAPDTACYAGYVNCGETKTGRVSVDSCDSDGLYAVGYYYRGTAGQSITITARSFDFAMSLLLVDGRANQPATVFKRIDEYSNGATATLTHTLPYTGDYIIFVTPGVRYKFGDYTMTLACANTPPPTSCTPSSGALCLSGGRFRVQASYATTAGSGQATGVALTSDTGYFWFFNSSNVEVVVKVLDGRGVNGKFWVFAGGLTDVDTLITVTDTQTGAVRTYRNPAGTKFQPIQDTSAF